MSPMKKVAYISLTLFAFSICVSADGLQNQKILSHDLKVKLTPSSHLMEVSDTVFVKNLRKSSSELFFKLHEGFVVTKLTSKAGECSYERSGNSITVRFRDPLDVGTIELFVKYSNQGIVGGNSRIEEDFVYVRPDYDWILSRKEDPSPAIITLIVPNKYLTVSVGDLKKTVLLGDNLTAYTYEDRHSNIKRCFAVSNQWEISKYNLKNCELLLYLTSKNMGKKDRLAQLLTRILKFYSNSFVDYPYNTFAYVEIPTKEINGYPTMVWLSLEFLSNLANAYFTENYVNLLAHEAAHIWFGSLVSAKRPPEDRNKWLEEGFAEYSSVLFMKGYSGAEYFSKYLRELIEIFFISEDEYIVNEDRPIIEGSRLYNKGPWIVHMLRYILGEEIFYKTIKTYLTQYAYKMAALEDFIKVSEQISGKKLDWFYDQWLKKGGAPEYTLDCKIQPTSGNRFLISGTVSQKLTLFDMPVEIHVRMPGKTSVERIRIRDKYTSFKLIVDKKPVSVVLDPENWIFRKIEFTDKEILSIFSERARIYTRRENFSEAKKHFDRIFQLDPEHLISHYRLGIFYFVQDQYDLALSEFQKTLSINKGKEWDVELWSTIRMGQVYDLMKQREKAVEMYNDALELPDYLGDQHENARNYLIKPYSKK